MPFMDEPTSLFPRNIVAVTAARYRIVQTSFIAISTTAGRCGGKV
jgi:hypothetical protein